MRLLVLSRVATPPLRITSERGLCAWEDEVMNTLKCQDAVILNLWHPIAALAEISQGEVHHTTLLEETLVYQQYDGEVVCWRVSDRSASEDARQSLPVTLAYGYLWTSLGTPKPLFDLPEYAEPDRRNMNAATIGVHVSAPRGIENFLDMGHFPYVHTDWLGAEPHTEVKDYDVDISIERDEIVATRCRFWQPKAAATATTGQETSYIYRVPHPYCSILYKSSPDPNRLDLVAVFLQPIDQEHTRAHMLLSLLDDENDDRTIKNFQLTIFGQDKPILENQVPKKLPLSPNAETPIRADKSAIAYRRWLSDKGVTYGVIPTGA